MTIVRVCSEFAFEREYASASSSSKNSTQGACERALSKIEARLRSLSPIHMLSTSEMPTEMNSRVALVGDGARDHGLAAAGRAVQQDAAARLLAKALEHARIEERLDDLDADRLLEIVHADDAGEANLLFRRALDRHDVGDVLAHDPQVRHGASCLRFEPVELLVGDEAFELPRLRVARQRFRTTFEQQQCTRRADVTERMLRILFAQQLVLRQRELTFAFREQTLRIAGAQRSVERIREQLTFQIGAGFLGHARIRRLNSGGQIQL